jgi:hypothetical protein
MNPNYFSFNLFGRLHSLARLSQISLDHEVWFCMSVDEFTQAIYVW